LWNLTLFSILICLSTYVYATAQIVFGLKSEEK